MARSLSKDPRAVYYIALLFARSMTVQNGVPLELCKVDLKQRLDPSKYEPKILTSPFGRLDKG